MILLYYNFLKRDFPKKMESGWKVGEKGKGWRPGQLPSKRQNGSTFHPLSKKSGKSHNS